MSKFRTLLICVAIPLAIGALSGLLAGDSMATFNQLNQPPLSPPGWVFPVVWTVLYILMGAASYLVLSSGKEQSAVRSALLLYAIQLAINFFWSIIFFTFDRYGLAFFWLLLLWTLVVATIVSFARLSRPAAALLLPYLLWVTFAAYLNLGVWLLN